MPFNPGRITEATEARVVIPVRVPWRAREELHAMADERGCSLNALLTDALTAALGIDLS
jgi:hypothetical protein